MATTAGPPGTFVARGNSIHSSLGTLAPLNSPTRRFYGSQDPFEEREPGVPNPNVYVVQPFKNASNPGESSLKSTMELINHFTSCYEAVKQLRSTAPDITAHIWSHILRPGNNYKKEHNKERESVLVSRTMTVTGINKINSRITLHRPAKQS